MDASNIVPRVSETDFGHMIGNAMSVNVVERLLLRILEITKNILPSQEDEWENGKRLIHLMRVSTRRPVTSSRQIFRFKEPTNDKRVYLVDSGASQHLVAL